jgi:hypothetical protein
MMSDSTVVGGRVHASHGEIVPTFELCNWSQSQTVLPKHPTNERKETPMPETEQTTDRWGVSRPVNRTDRIARLVHSTPACDARGLYPSPPPVATAPVTTPGTPPTMVNALLAAAEVVGVDPAGLVDSVAFMRSVAPISPADTAGLQAAVADALAANPALAVVPAAPGMRANPAQGGSASGWAPAPATTTDRVRREASKISAQPRPPGSTAY